MIARVLVALDGSARAPGVFDAAAEIAGPFGATLFPFRALFVPPEFPAAAAGSRPDTLPEHMTKVALDDLHRLTARPVPLTVRVDPPTVGFGTPWRMIVAMSEDLDVDLIVLGSHGYHALDRILGTTAASVANLAHRHVFVVRERAERTIPIDRGSSPYRTTGAR
ncbi:MAG TPA: universal stress protein [Polyangiaceae bacterium]